jgi:hypothetical protein
MVKGVGVWAYYGQQGQTWSQAYTSGTLRQYILGADATIDFVVTSEGFETITSFPEDVPMKEAVTRALIKGLIELVGG